MAPLIHIMRHAQGYHNLGGERGYKEPDPRLTTLGITQCRQVEKAATFRPDLIMASPMKRTIETAAVSFQTAIEDGKFIVLLPSLQEIGAYPCNVGSSRTDISAEFGNVLRTDLISEEWFGEGNCNTWRTKDIQERARQARVAIRLFARAYTREHPDIPDPQILVTSHGDFINFLVEDYTSATPQSNSHFQNGEVRTYKFTGVPESSEARLVETSASLLRRNAVRANALQQQDALRTWTARLQTQDQNWNRESIGHPTSILF
ncbi:histidine phosphatase superfamily [Hypoxylon sp. NC0597]|nr:histidine phosphatase superfamily [Hypoxylon sp. NC0597]